MEVSLDFTGNESDLVSAFDNVGKASKAMSDQVDDAGSRLRDSSGAFDAASEGADTAETRFTGFYDTIGGTRDALAAFSDESLSTSDKLIALGQAGADLAGGMVGFVIPAVQGLWTKLVATSAATAVVTAAQSAWAVVTGVVTTAMGALNAVIRANPILAIVSLIFILVAAFATLWQNSEGFRNFFINMWNGIKTIVGNVVDWIVGVWKGIPDFFRGVVSAIGNIFSGIGNAITGAFKGAVNFLINGLNVLISGVNLVIRGINAVNPFDDIPSIPKIPRLHSGGTVPGMPGEDVLTVLQAGEHVGMKGQGGGGAARIVFDGDTDSAFATAFNKLVRDKVIRVVLE